jgi:hypothetical protein
LAQSNLKEKGTVASSATANRRDRTHPANVDAMALVLSCVGMVCWIVCFWWMHRISSRQDAFLQELHRMTKRIERLSKVEHEMIREVHPQVNEIKNHVENVREAVEK